MQAEPGHFEWVVKLIEDQRLNISTMTLIVRENLEELSTVRAFALARSRKHHFRLLTPHPSTPDTAGIYERAALPVEEALAALKPVLQRHRPKSREERANEDVRETFLRLNRSVVPPCLVNRIWGEPVRKLREKEGPVIPGHAPCPHQQDCLLGEVCPGLAPQYTALFGTAAFKPVRPSLLATLLGR